MDQAPMVEDLMVPARTVEDLMAAAAVVSPHRAVPAAVTTDPREVTAVAVADMTPRDMAQKAVTVAVNNMVPKAVTDLEVSMAAKVVQDTREDNNTRVADSTRAVDADSLLARAITRASILRNIQAKAGVQADPAREAGEVRPAATRVKEVPAGLAVPAPHQEAAEATVREWATPLPAGVHNMAQGPAAFNVLSINLK